MENTAIFTILQAKWDQAPHFGASCKKGRVQFSLNDVQFMMIALGVTEMSYILECSYTRREVGALSSSQFAFMDKS